MSLKLPNFVSIYFMIILFGDIVGTMRQGEALYAYKINHISLAIWITYHARAVRFRRLTPRAQR